uniref:Uncharacterized protein n=1 Tax=Nymphaea colorata TaxID=210225 RepID=A0A5K1GPA0_9MAGN
MLHGSKGTDGHFVEVELTRGATEGERQDVHSVADGYVHGSEDVRRKAAPDPAHLVDSYSGFRCHPLSCSRCIAKHACTGNRGASGRAGRVCSMALVVPR